MSWLILGAGVSGIEAGRFLRQKNETVFLYDDKHIPSEKQSKLTLLGVNLVKKIDSSFLLKNIDQGVVLSPGISLAHPIVQDAKKIGIQTLSETELVLPHYKGKVIAVTGTNGKSTTCHMIYHILKTLKYKVCLSGNIGTPLSSSIHENPEIIVLELSSYQLEQMQSIRANIGVFTTFSPDHLERHKTLKDYFLAKWKLFDVKFSSISTAIFDKKINKHIKLYVKEKTEIPTDTVEEKEVLYLQENLTNLEPHNILNATLACKACLSITNASFTNTVQALSNFKKIPHRFEQIDYIYDTLIINDSKATNLESTIAALESCEKDVILLLGGISKTIDFSPLKKYKYKVNEILCFGDASSIIYKSLCSSFKINSYASLSSLMLDLHAIIKRNKAKFVLLSPACASYDEFKSFNHRGDFFKKEIKKIQEKIACKKNPRKTF